MKKYISAFIAALLTGIMFMGSTAEARGGSSGYYRSAKSGQFVTKSYAKSYPSTTIRSTRYR